MLAWYWPLLRLKTRAQRKTYLRSSVYRKNSNPFSPWTHKVHIDKGSGEWIGLGSKNKKGNHCNNVQKYVTNTCSPACEKNMENKRNVKHFARLQQGSFPAPNPNSKSPHVRLNRCSLCCLGFIYRAIFYLTPAARHRRRADQRAPASHPASQTDNVNAQAAFIIAPGTGAKGKAGDRGNPLSRHKNIKNMLTIKICWAAQQHATCCCTPPPGGQTEVTHTAHLHTSLVLGGKKWCKDSVGFSDEDKGMPLPMYLTGFNLKEIYKNIKESMKISFCFSYNKNMEFLWRTIG